MPRTKGREPTKAEMAALREAIKETMIEQLLDGLRRMPAHLPKAKAMAATDAVMAEVVRRFEEEA